MERVASPRGIDGHPRIGHGPAIGRLLRALAAAAAFGVAGALEAQETDEKNTAAADVKTVAPATKGATETRVLKLLEGLDANDFEVRQEASKAIADLLWKEFDVESGDERALFDRFTKDARGRQRTLSPEQRERLRYAKQNLDAWTHLPGALRKQGIVRGDAALHLIRERSGILITADDETVAPLPATEVDLSGDRDARSVNGILARLCDATGTKPTLLPNGDIRLTQLAENERLLASKDLIGVMHCDGDGLPTKLTLQMEPGHGAILAFLDRKGSFTPNGIGKEYTFDLDEGDGKISPHPGLPLDIAHDGRPAWKGPAQNQIHRTMDAFHATNAYAVVAVEPVRAALVPGDPATTLGAQDIRASEAEQLPSGEWRLTVNASVFGDVPWPPTPYPWDVLTYSLAHSNRYAAVDDAGVHMPATVVETTFHMRTMTAILTFPRKPVTFETRAYATMDVRGLDLPGVRPPARIPAPQPPRDPAGG